MGYMIDDGTVSIDGPDFIHDSSGKAIGGKLLSWDMPRKFLGASSYCSAAGWPLRKGHDLIQLYRFTASGLAGDASPFVIVVSTVGIITGLTRWRPTQRRFRYFAYHGEPIQATSAPFIAANSYDCSGFLCLPPVSTT